MADETVQCRRCGASAPKMAERPFKGPLGEQVWVSTCGPCWGEWVRMGTKVINELRLDFGDPRHSQVYDQYLKEFLKIE